MSGGAAAALAVPKHIQGRTVIATLPKKLAKRAILAQNHASRRKKREEAVAEKSARKQYFKQTKAQNTMARMRVQNERAWRREDWIRGPLAPQRAVGAYAETFGALTTVEVLDPKKPSSLGKTDYGIVVGDRVCVTKPGHKDYGTIANVKEIREDSEGVILQAANVTDVVTPEYILNSSKQDGRAKVQPYEKPLHFRDVRLVVPLPDPETGKLKDHIINELSLRKITRREQKGIDPPTRYITNLEPPQYIPYPEKSDQDKEEHEIDTLRIEVDEKTWIPTLHMPPMPPTVIDELRNKFGKFRIRHDDEYVAKLAKKDLKATKKARSVDLMMTPLKQARRRERKQRKLLGRPELDDSSLAKIGEFMEKKLQGTAVDPRSIASTVPPS